MKVVNYIGGNQKRFDELMELFLAKEYRVTQRAAWAVSYCVEEHPQLIKKYLRKILLNLEKHAHVAVKRNTLRLLQFIELPSSLHGIAAEICFRLLNDLKEPIAVHVFSMSVLSKLCRHHPELINELKLSINAKIAYGSAGFHARARKVLKELNRIQP